MKAVILAAGKGTRMRPLTDKVPKPMLKVADRPLLEYAMDILSDYAEEIIIVIGYLGDQIRSHFGDSYKGVPIKYAEQEEQLGTGHAIMCAEKYLDGRFIVLNGDEFFTRDVYEKALAHPLCVVAKKVDDPSRWGIYELDKDGYAVGLEEKPKDPKSDCANTGIYVMDKRLIDFMRHQPKSIRGEYELTDALKEVINRDKVNCLVIEDGWWPVGIPDDLQKLEGFLKG